MSTGYNTTLAQVRQTLSDLDTAYLDLFMLHFPQCWGTLCDGKAPEGTWQDSWRALEVRSAHRDFHSAHHTVSLLVPALTTAGL